MLLEIKIICKMGGTPTCFFVIIIREINFVSVLNKKSDKVLMRNNQYHLNLGNFISKVRKDKLSIQQRPQYHSIFF